MNEDFENTSDDIGLANLLKEKPCEYILRCFSSEIPGQDCINYARCPYYKRYQIYQRHSQKSLKSDKESKLNQWHNSINSIKFRLFNAYSLFLRYRRFWK
jgi:hypothetical protein